MNKPINLRMSIPEACKYYAAHIDFQWIGENTFFGFYHRYDRENAAQFDLDKCFRWGVVPLYARHAGTANPWVKVQSDFVDLNLMLWMPHNSGEDWRIMPHSMMVPCDYSVMLKDIRAVLRDPLAAVRKADCEWRLRRY